MKHVVKDSNSYSKYSNALIMWYNYLFDWYEDRKDI